MAAWLRNLQGQLTELASEVLNEATADVPDPTTELQVKRKSLEELQGELAVMRAEREAMERRCDTLSEQLTDAGHREHSTALRSASAIEQRDQQIRSLQMELEKRHHGSRFSTDDDAFGIAGDDFGRMEDELRQLRAEVTHWRRVVQETNDDSDSTEVTELKHRLSRIRDEHQDEILALQHSHSEQMRQLKLNFDSQLESIHKNPTDSQPESIHKNPTDNWQDFGMEMNDESTSRDDNEGLYAQLEQLRMDKANLVREKEQLVQEIALTREANIRMTAQIDQSTNDAEERARQAESELRSVHSRLASFNSEIENAHQMVQQVQAEMREMREANAEKENTLRQQLEESNKKQIEKAQSAEGDRLALEAELSRLGAENNELTSAYNDLNDEFERHKAEYGSVLTSNRDLAARIESLKADLIEYEEKYEVCKAENTETVRHLEKLTNNFDKLKTGFESAKSHNRHQDEMINVQDEVERLKLALDASKEDRDRLRSDVDNFRDTFTAIDNELEGLRDGNRRLLKENRTLSEAITKFEQVKHSLVDSTEQMTSLRSHFTEMQEDHHNAEMSLRNELEQSKEKIDELEKCITETRNRAESTEALLHRYRSLVGDERVAMLEAVKSKGSGTHSTNTECSNNGWDKMAEWDATDATTTGDRGGDEGEMGRAELVRDDEHQQLQMRVEDLEKEIYTLQEQLVKSREMLDQCSLREREMAMENESFRLKMENERQELTDTLKDLTLAHARCEDLLKTAYQENEEIKSEMAQLQLDLKAVECERSEILSTFNAVQVEHQQCAGHMEHFHREKNELTAQLSNLQSQMAQLTLLKEELSVKNAEMCSEQSTERSSLDSKLHELNEKLAKLEGTNRELANSLQQKEEQLSNWNGQMEAMTGEYHILKDNVASMAQQRDQLLDNVQQLSTEREKAMKECARLREHLVAMEETSNREANAAEQRETELRERLRYLETVAEQAENSVSASSWEMSELVRRCGEAESGRIALENRLTTTEKILAESKKAVSSLQQILKELSSDHEEKISSLNEEMVVFKRKITALTMEVEEKTAQVENGKEELQRAGNQCLLLQAGLAEREQLMAQLEAEISKPMMAKDPHLDPTVLRQLFISYFTAQPDKKHDIALLLASDLARIQAGHEGRGGWLASRSRRPSQGGNFSITEQFIRFLESESAAVSGAQLPVRASPTSPLRPTELRQQLQPQSSNDLRAILDT